MNKPTEEEWFAGLFYRLSQSNFRSKVKLSQKDKLYIGKKGLDTIESHARDFIAMRLSPAHPTNDGKQTPMRGHPVFIAQHATATCCRGCLSKWHRISEGKELSLRQQEYVVKVIMTWVEEQYKKEN